MYIMRKTTSIVLTFVFMIVGYVPFWAGNIMLDDDTIYEKADQAPTLPKKQDTDWNIFFAKLIDYPTATESMYVDGDVYVNFIVEKDGRISNTIVENSSVTIYGNNCDISSDACQKLFVEAVKEGLRKTSRLRPATIGGESVRYRMKLLVHFGSTSENVQSSQNIIQIYIKGKKSLDYLYLNDKKPYKDMHLYHSGDDYLVSGINRSVSELTEDEYTKISKKSKKTANDILELSDERTINNYVYDLIRLDNNKDVIRPQMKTEGGLDKYMKDHLSTSFESIYVIASFIVETDGTISCPIVEKGNDLKAIKNVIHHLRKTKNWQPALKDGVPVKARISHVFSYKRVVTIVTRTIPVYNQPNRNIEYGNPRRW